MENTSRSPRLMNWRGRKPSRAMIDDTGEVGVGGVGGQDEDGGGGELEDDVQHPVAEDGPAQDREDVSCSLRVGCRWWASTEMPTKKVAEDDPMAIRVRPRSWPRAA